MKKTLIILLCLSMIAGCLSGCASDEAEYVPTGDALIYDDSDLEAMKATEELPPQEFSLVYYAEKSMNPLTASDFSNRVVLSLIYQGLFSVSRNYEAVPILCDQFAVSPNYKTYTFYLSPDAVFSDGSMVTVDDVFATYQAALESKYYSARFTHVKEIIPNEDGSITFELRTPMENLPLLLDVPIVKAAQVQEPEPLGTGPYILEHTLSGAHLRKNPGWWCKSPDLTVRADSIPLVEAQSPTHIRDQFEFEDVGLVCADPCSDAYADYRCDYELWDIDSGNFLYLACNVAYSEIFEEDTLRSVLTYAIDREALAEDNYRGFAKSATLPASPGSPYYSPGLARKYAYDPIKFVDALDRIKMPEEPLTLLVNRDDSLRLRTARDIATMLTESGLPVITVELSTREYHQTILNADYDMYLGQTRLSANMDLSHFFRPYGELRYGGLADPTLYAQCLSALENSGNYYNLHQSVANDGRLVPILFSSYAVYALRGLVTDLQPSRDNVFFYTLGKTADQALIPVDYSAE